MVTFKAFNQSTSHLLTPSRLFIFSISHHMHSHFVFVLSHSTSSKPNLIIYSHNFISISINFPSFSINPITLIFNPFPSHSILSQHPHHESHFIIPTSFISSTFLLPFASITFSTIHFHLYFIFNFSLSFILISFSKPLYFSFIPNQSSNSFLQTFFELITKSPPSSIIPFFNFIIFILFTSLLPFLHHQNQIN